MLKKLLSLLIALLSLSSCLAFDSYADTLTVSASSAVLIEADSGRVLYEKNADTRRLMASTTKIMTALVAIESGDLERRVKIPKEATGIEGSSVYLVEGETLTLHELLYALMLRSANDAATAIAIAVGGDVSSFADMMNERAESLGLVNTHFDNPHGLDSEGHYTTARELAIITAEAMNNPIFSEIVSTYKKTLPMYNEPDVRLVVNHNKLLRTYEGCIGVKTGYTMKSGRCLVSAAERDGIRLIAVTLDAPDDWKDHKRMLDHGFSLLKSIVISGDSVCGLVPTVGSTVSQIKYSAFGSVRVTVDKDTDNLTTVTELSRFYYAPVKEGDIIGRLVFYDGDKELASLPIKALNDAPKRKERLNFFQWFLSLFGLF